MLTNPCLCYIICLVRSERKALRRGNGGVAQLARASGSYPAGRWFKSDRRYHFWPVGQAVKTPPFHGGNMGSIPVRVTNEKQLSKEGCFSLLSTACRKLWKSEREHLHRAASAALILSRFTRPKSMGSLGDPIKLKIFYTVHLHRAASAALILSRFTRPKSIQ